MKLCAVTILYHPDEAFLSHVRTYIDVIDKLFVIDNSEQTVDVVRHELNNRYSQKVTFISNNGNLGVAASLNMACGLAVQEAFDWILTMDQDSYFETHTFFDLSLLLMQKKNIGIIAASYFGKVPFKEEYSEDFFQVPFVVTSGNLVCLHAWELCGGFEDKLFIDEVDTDFCLKMKANNFLVLLSKQTFLQHELGQMFSIRLPFTKQYKPIGIHKPWRMYFTVRNGLYVSFKYGFKYPTVFFERFKHLLVKLLLIIFYYPNKMSYLKFYLKGIKDFIFGRYKPINIW